MEFHDKLVMLVRERLGAAHSAARSVDKEWLFAGMRLDRFNHYLNHNGKLQQLSSETIPKQ